MNFRKSFKRPLTPSPSFFGKLCCKFFLKFMTEVSSIMAKICNINFWIENDPPPPFGTFPKIHPFWKGNASLTYPVFRIRKWARRSRTSSALTLSRERMGRRGEVSPTRECRVLASQAPPSSSHLDPSQPCFKNLFMPRVSQQMVRRSWSLPGQVYGVDIDTSNSGALYADSFILHEHYRF